ncbi:MAG: hypothetical protein WD627_01540, partial [Actinomycetota bacterium]
MLPLGGVVVTSGQERFWKLRRTTGWLIAGIFLASLLMLSEVGTLLKAVQSSGQRSFGTAVFSGFDVNPLNITDLVDALELWRDTAAGLVLLLIKWHLFADLLFAVTFAVILAILLRWAGARNPWSRPAAGEAPRPWRRRYLTFGFIIPALYLLFDLMEDFLVWGVLVNGELADPGRPPLILMRSVSLAKWIAVLAAFIVLIAWWLKEDNGSVKAAGQAIRKARQGGEQSPPLALFGLIVLV